MGKEKGGFLTPKAIANRIKSKGLQKLRWFCQMCQKQCRDENGFKCHCMSESHQRQLLLFADNPDKFLDSFSKEFLDSFLHLLKRQWGTKRVHCNIVYQEYIADKLHTHMNSTQWETLTELVKWLGREGHCVVDETPKGWYITYVDRDPEAIKRQESAAKKEKMDMDDDERMAKFLEKQIEKAKEKETEKPKSEFTELQRLNEEEKVSLNFSRATSSVSNESTEKQAIAAAGANPLSDLGKAKPQVFPSASSSPSSSSKASRSKPSQKRKSALEEIVEEQKAKTSKIKRHENWITKGIIVKVITKKLGEKYYKKKGEITAVKDKFVAVVEMLDSGDKLKLDQAHIETVIPQPGRLLRILNGVYRGETATMMSLDERRFSITARIESGKDKGKSIDGFSYEDVCKLAT
ncbi:DNA/RNA-binding protein KIN17-like [Rhopilema esculentum]|uniref:DNA/RNA-binding protein KIN17-like n=1 Tax=Rhopilema esculentum TaxID=499914 RepID=UPI0031D2D0C8